MRDDPHGLRLSRRRSRTGVHRRTRRAQRGQSAYEYSMIIACIGMVVLATVTALGRQTNTGFCGAGKGVGGSICGSYTSYTPTAATSQPDSILMGPDNNIWISEGAISPAGDKIAKISLSGKLIAEYTVPTASSDPGGMCIGPDNNIWFGEWANSGLPNPPGVPVGKVGRVTVATGHIDEFQLSNPNAGPSGCVAGPDGAVWFTEHFTGKIEAFAPATFPAPASLIHSFTIPNGCPDSPIVGKAHASIWYADAGCGQGGVSEAGVGAITLGGGLIGQYLASPTSMGMRSAHGQGIVLGTDGYYWFCELMADKFGRVNPSNGHIDEYDPAAGAFPEQLVVARDGNLYASMFWGGAVNKIVTNGAGAPTITALANPNGDATAGLAVGIDSNIWYTGGSAGTVGKLY